MTHFTHNNKRIIWDRKSTQIVIVIVSLLFVAASIWTKEKTSSLMFWGGIIFFGGCALFTIIRLLNPRNLFVTPDTALGKQILAEQFKKQQEDLGFFVYNKTGFSFEEYTVIKEYNWADIETVFGFKEDRYNTDDICMDIFTTDKSYIRLTENTPGWYQFNERLTNYIPTIPKNWDAEIAIPAFETKMILLFDKKGRTKEQAETECYKE